MIDELGYKMVAFSLHVDKHICNNSSVSFSARQRLLHTINSLKHQKVTLKIRLILMLKNINIFTVG